MSVYIPTQWRNGQEPYINAFNLNHIESGIVSAHEEIEEIVDGTKKIAKATHADTSTTVDKATSTHIGGSKVWVDDSDPAHVIGYIDAR